MICAMCEVFMNAESNGTRTEVSFLTSWVTDPADMLRLLSFEFLHYGRADEAWLGTDGQKALYDEENAPMRDRPFASRFFAYKTTGFCSGRTAGAVHLLYDLIMLQDPTAQTPEMVHRNVIERLDHIPGVDPSKAMFAIESMCQCLKPWDAILKAEVTAFLTEPERHEPPTKMLKPFKLSGWAQVSYGLTVMFCLHNFSHTDFSPASA